MLLRCSSMAKAARKLAVVTSSGRARARPPNPFLLEHVVRFSANAGLVSPKARPFGLQDQRKPESDVLQLLNESIANKQPSKALAYFDQLSAPADQKVRQQLASLLAKNGGRLHAARAFDLIRSIFRLPDFTADKSTQNTINCVLHACLRQNMLEKAKQIYEDSLTAGVISDRSTVETLLKVLVKANQIPAAVRILNEPKTMNGIAATQETYFPVLKALMKRGSHSKMISLMDHGKSYGIKFTMKTYAPLVDMVQGQLRSPEHWKGVNAFMAYASRAMRHRWSKLGLDINELERLKTSLNIRGTLGVAMVNTLVKSLLRSDRIASAIAIVKELPSRREIASSEDTYLLVLTALVMRGKYNEAGDLLEHGLAHGIKFTSKTFNLLIAMGRKKPEEQHDAEAQENFMKLVYDAMEEYEVRLLGIVFSSLA